MTVEEKVKLIQNLGEQYTKALEAVARIEGNLRNVIAHPIEVGEVAEAAAAKREKRKKAADAAIAAETLANSVPLDDAMKAEPKADQKAEPKAAPKAEPKDEPKEEAKLEPKLIPTDAELREKLMEYSKVTKMSEAMLVLRAYGANRNVSEVLPAKRIAMMEDILKRIEDAKAKK